MQRIKLSLPEKFAFTTSIRIRISDINYGGHVGNDAFLSLIHEARVQFYKHFGYSELNIGGVATIMADVAIEYKKELLQGNLVYIDVTANDFDKLGFDIYYHLYLLENDKPITAGKAKTGIMCFDYATKKKVAIPAEVIEKLSNY